MNKYKKLQILFQTCLIWVCCFCYTFAQNSSIEQKLKEVEKQFNTINSVSSSASKVDASIFLSINNVHRGTQFQAAVLLNIQNSWHVNAHIPTMDFLIGTELNLTLPDNIQLINTHYPKAEEVNFAFAGSALKVYQDTVVIYIELKTLSNIPEGNYNIKGTLQVQACNDEVCLAPSNIDISIPVEVVDHSQPAHPINTEIFSSVSSLPSTISNNASTNNIISDMFTKEGTVLAFLGIFVIGLALNLTPCVYPMFSVTVSLFSAQTDRKTWRVFLKAVIYVLGISTMYSILGVSAALSGSLFGGIIQSPLVLFSIGALLIALALSMFGLYELQIPYKLRSKLGGTNNKTGIIGIYLSGLVVGIFAAPCIGPPIIALLAFIGIKGDPVFGFWAFFVLSLGLGVPYLILGTFSNLLTKIPRSGAWMVWVKKIFGFVMLGAALFYIGLALYPKETIYVLPLMFVIGGIYLGFIEKSGKENRKLIIFQRVFGIACIILSFVFFQALQKPAIDWQSYSPEKLNEARRLNKPVMLDFYADWCIPCLELDRLTFTDERVINASQDFIKLKVDLTQFGSEDSELLRQKFNVAGVPTIIFLNAEGQEIPASRIVGYVNPDEFIEKLGNL